MDLGFKLMVSLGQILSHNQQSLLTKKKKKLSLNHLLFGVEPG